MIRGVVLWRVVGAMFVHAVAFGEYRYTFNIYDPLLRPLDVWITTRAPNGSFELLVTLVIGTVVALLFALPHPTKRQYAANLCAGLVWTLPQIPLTTGALIGFGASPAGDVLKRFETLRVNASISLPVLAALLLVAQRVRSTWRPRTSAPRRLSGTDILRFLAAMVATGAVLSAVALFAFIESRPWVVDVVIVGASIVAPPAIGMLCSLRRPTPGRYFSNGAGVLLLPLVVATLLFAVTEPAPGDDDSVIMLMAPLVLFTTTPGLIGLALGSFLLKDAAGSGALEARHL